MTSSSASVSVASQMIRPVSLFLSTEDAEEYSDASRVAVTLRDPIQAQDGFKLVYGLRSFGYNTNVMNISEYQKNNIFRIEVTYQRPELNYVNDTTLPTPHAVAGTIHTVVHDIQLSDGNYSTLDSLFAAINLSIAQKIDSGWLMDYSLPATKLFNQTYFDMTFNAVDNRYITISLKTVTITVKAGYVITVPGDPDPTNVAAWQFASKIRSITIRPHPDKPQLYNLLFTNVTANSGDRPICLPSYKTDEGINPPDYIQFNINAQTYFSYNTDLNPTDENFTTTDVNIWETVEWDIIEGGNELLLDTANNIHPLNPRIMDSLDYIGYHIPFIHPFYMDISTSLENANVTSSGEHKNLLHRQFVVGVKDGNTSFFQNWESPIYHILDSRAISSIEIKFESQGNRWNFFNMEYALELIIFEVEDEASLPNFEDVPFQMPADDSFTTEIRNYTNSKTNPYPILGSGQQRKTVEYNDVTRRRVRPKY